MTTQLSLYNNALLLCEERKLSSLSEARESRRLLDTVWERPAIDECLQMGQWNFAMRSVEVTPSPSVTPALGFTYAFDRPTDLMRTVAVCSDERFTVPLLQYQTDGPYWFADIDPIYVRYVSNGDDYGADLSLWPPNFCRYVEAYLADAIIGRLTQDKQTWQKINAIKTRALSEAKSSDAMEQPTQMTPPGSWVRSRSRGPGGDRGNRGSLIG